MKLKEKQKQKKRRPEGDYTKVSPGSHLFMGEFEPGKGMRSGGMGGLLIGDHYKVKAERDRERAEKARNAQWRKDYEERMEQKRLEQEAIEFFKLKQ